MKLQKAVALKISNLMIKNNLTRYALSKKACISEQTLKYIIDERNKDIKLKTIASICDSLNMSIAEFFEDDLFNKDKLELD